MLQNCRTYNVEGIWQGETKINFISGNNYSVAEKLSFVLNKSGSVYLLGSSPRCKILAFADYFLSALFFRVFEGRLQGITLNHGLYISTQYGSLPYLFVISRLREQ